ncbi:MAG: polysaccharide deacetylase family protein [Candidatus Pacearchaeota archaeon]
MTKKINGAVSIDTDSLDLFYQNIYGKKISERDITYKLILPRYLDFFKKRRIKATFFIIGSHIKSRYHKELLKRMVDEGHELANHTFSHLLSFSNLSANMKEKEIAKCENIIRASTGIKPVGFRAPGWDIDRKTISILEKRDYLYDSSIFPTLFNPLSVLMLSLNKKNSKHYASMVNFKTSFAPLSPYRIGNEVYKKGNSKIFEIPVNSIPPFRLPFYGTFLFASKSELLFDLSLKILASSKIPLNYVLHSIELYDRDKDIQDNRIKSINHPSVLKSFGYKIKLYNHIFDKFKDYYNISTIKSLASKIVLD